MYLIWHIKAVSLLYVTGERPIYQGKSVNKHCLFAFRWAGKDCIMSRGNSGIPLMILFRRTITTYMRQFVKLKKWRYFSKYCTHVTCQQDLTKLAKKPLRHEWDSSTNREMNEHATIKDCQSTGEICGSFAQPCFRRANTTSSPETTKVSRRHPRRPGWWGKGMRIERRKVCWKWAVVGRKVWRKDRTWKRESAPAAAGFYKMILDDFLPRLSSGRNSG